MSSNNNIRQTRSRTARQHDENAEIAPRMTRAKAAAAGTDNGVTALKPKALESKTANTAAVSRKRAALGDLSNNPNKDKASALNKGGKSLVSLKTTTSSSSTTARPALAGRQPTLAPSAKIPAASHLRNARHNHIAASKQKSVIEESSRVSKSTTSSSSSSALPIPVYTQDNSSKARVLPQKQLPKQQLQKTNPSHTIDAVEEPEDRPHKKLKVEHEETSSAKQQDWDDLDAEDMDDPLMVSEYAPEIFEFLYKLQDRYMPNPNYMDDQKNLEWEYRSILVDWLVEVHTKFRLLPETLFLAVNIVDRFMSIRVVSLAKVQLVGIAALFIAAKYEEVFCPPIKSYSYVSDGGYDDEEILNAERFVLQVLNFELSYPNPMNFLRRISKADNYDLETRTIGKYLLEISLFDHRLLKYTPSDLSAAAMFLSRKILNRGEWDSNLIHYSGGCDEAKMEPMVAIMVDYLYHPVKHEAFFKKYASKRFMKASIIARSWAKHHAKEYPVVSET